MITETLTLKQAIVSYIERFEIISFTILIDALEESYPTETNQEKLQAISELVQSNTIKRYDYTLAGNTAHRQFFMVSESKLV